jgi:hypothetical protein
MTDSEKLLKMKQFKSFWPTHACTIPARGVDLANMGDISHPTSSIARTAKDVPDARINTPTDLVEVCIMIDFIRFCLSSYATN